MGFPLWLTPLSSLVVHTVVGSCALRVWLRFCFFVPPPEDNLKSICGREVLINLNVCFQVQSRSELPQESLVKQVRILSKKNWLQLFSMCMRTFMFVHVQLCPYVSMHVHVSCIPLYLRPFAVRLRRRCEAGSPVKACLSDILSIWGSASSPKAWYKSSQLLRIKSPPAAAASVTACCLYQATKCPGSRPSGEKLTYHKLFFSNIFLLVLFQQQCPKKQGLFTLDPPTFFHSVSHHNLPPF